MGGSSSDPWSPWLNTSLTQRGLPRAALAFLAAVIDPEMARSLNFHIGLVSGVGRAWQAELFSRAHRALHPYKSEDSS